MEWTVEGNQVDGYNIIGLKCEWDDGPNTFLIVNYGGGEADYPYNDELMHKALYDLYQCRNDLKEGDTFLTPHGDYKAVSFHIVPIEEASNES